MIHYMIIFDTLQYDPLYIEIIIDTNMIHYMIIMIMSMILVS